MNNTIKAISIIALGLLIWVILVYASLAFVNAEATPFSWTKTDRSIIVFLAFIYIAFSPLVVIELKDQFKKDEKPKA